LADDSRARVVCNCRGRDIEFFFHWRLDDRERAFEPVQVALSRFPIIVGEDQTIGEFAHLLDVGELPAYWLLECEAELAMNVKIVD
jgi:hypothetical protein